MLHFLHFSSSYRHYTIIKIDIQVLIVVFVQFLMKKNRLSDIQEKQCSFFHKVNMVQSCCIKCSKTVTKSDNYCNKNNNYFFCNSFLRNHISFFNVDFLNTGSVSIDTTSLGKSGYSILQSNCCTKRFPSF